LKGSTQLRGSLKPSTTSNEPLTKVMGWGSLESMETPNFSHNRDGNLSNPSLRLGLGLLRGSHATPTQSVGGSTADDVVRFMEVFEKKDLSQVMAVAQTHSGIIIVDGDPDIFLDEMFKMFPEELYCKVFFKQERLYDPRENILVPKHRLATEEEIKALEERHIPVSSLPKLSRRDIIARWEGWKKDDIIAIEREGEDGLYFRIIF
ncbi:hypothetical protein BZG36_05789, partial [Bifiguratus adelaidae]